MSDMFVDATRSEGDLAGVLEVDGETSYFYLYRTGAADPKILGAIHVASGVPSFDERDVQVTWDAAEDRVGLFIKSHLWALFDVRTNVRLGGNYVEGGESPIPKEVARGFARRKP